MGQAITIPPNLLSAIGLQANHELPRQQAERRAARHHGVGLGGALEPFRDVDRMTESLRLAGFPEIVVRRGVVAFRDGAPTGEAGGEMLRFPPPEPGP